MKYRMLLLLLVLAGAGRLLGQGGSVGSCPAGEYVSAVSASGVVSCSVASSLPGLASNNPPFSLDGTQLSTHLVLSPYSFNAVCDGTQVNGTLNGTDDRAAMRLMFAKALATGAAVHLPGGKLCRADMPGGVITGFSVTSSVVTVQMANKLMAGDIVTPQGLRSAGGIFLNGVPLTVLTASATQFTANFYHADVANTTDAGYGPSPAFEINGRDLHVFGDTNAAGSAGSGMTSQIGGQGGGPMFQLSYDKTAQIRTISRDASGVITGTFDPMPGGLGFFSNENLIVSQTTGGAIDGNYGVSAIDNVAGTFTLGSGTSKVATGTLVGGLLHSPWTNFDADGAQGYEFENLSLADFQVANMTACQIDQFSSCGYQPGSTAIADWRGGNGVLKDVDLSRWEYGLHLVQADFMKIDGLQVENGHIGIYFGPQSSPNSDVSDYNDYGMERSIEIDGSEAVHIRNSHFRSGTPAMAGFGIVNRVYDTSGYTGYAGNGGYPANGIDLRDIYFEANNPGTCGRVAPAFIDIDANQGAGAPTRTVVIENASVVNSGVGASCNVPYFVRVGPALASQPAFKFSNNIAIVNPAESGSFIAWVNNYGKPTLKMDSRDESVMGVPLYVNQAGGTAIGEYEHTGLVAPTGTSFLSAGWARTMDGNISHCDANGSGCTWTLKTGAQATGATGSGTPTAMAVSSSSNSPAYGDSVTLTATVSPATAPGTASFQDGAGALGSGTLASGTASLATAGLTMGAHSITAVYNGPSPYSGSTSSAITVNVGSSGSGGLGVRAGVTDGTTVGLPGFGAGRFGQALTGTNDSNYVSLPTAAFPANSPVTIEFWAQNTTTGSIATVLAMGGVGWIGIEPSGTLRVSIVTDLDSGINISDGAWHHCAVVIAGGTISTFVDGVAGATVAAGWNGIPSSAPYVGRNGPAGLAWGGSIDELAVWKTARYGGAFTPPAAAYTGSEAGLTALYHLDGTAANSMTR